MFYRLFWCFSGASSTSTSQSTGSQHHSLVVASPSGPASCWLGFLSGSSNQRGTTTRIGNDTAEIPSNPGTSTRLSSHGYGGPAKSAGNDVESIPALVGSPPGDSIEQSAGEVGLVAHTPAKTGNQDVASQPRIGTGSTRAPGTSASEQSVSRASQPLHGDPSEAHARPEEVRVLEIPDTSPAGVLAEGGPFSTPRGKSSAGAAPSGVHFDNTAEKDIHKDQGGDAHGSPAGLAGANQGAPSSPQKSMSPFMLTPKTDEQPPAGQDDAENEALIADKILKREEETPYLQGELVATYEGQEAIDRAAIIINEHTPEQGSLRIAMFDITNHRLINTLEKAAAKGITIYLVTDKAQFNGATQSVKDSYANLLRQPTVHAAAASGRVTGTVGRMHTKLFITQYTALMGGGNWTKWGEVFNWELMVEFAGKRALKMLNERFQRVWNGCTTSGISHDGVISDMMGNLPTLSELGAAGLSDCGTVVPEDSASRMRPPATPAGVTPHPRAHMSTPGIPMPAFPNASTHPGMPYEEVRQVITQQISAIFGAGFVARNSTQRVRAIEFDIPRDFFHDMLRRAIDGNVVTDQRGNGTARLTGRKEFNDGMAKSWQNFYHMHALQSIKEYIKSHLKPYARQISPTLGIPTIEWAVHVADHLWHIFWDYTQQEQLGVDWAELEKQVDGCIPVQVAVVEQTVRTEFELCLPESARYDRLYTFNKERDTAPNLVMMLLWLHVRSFSNITDQVNRLQSQFSKLLSRKTDETDQRKRAISVYMITANVIRWGREFIHFGIKPGELRHVKRFYDTNFKPLSLEQEFIQYFANKMAEIQIDSYEREHLNTIEQWSIALEHMSAIATRLLQTYKFSPDQVNDKSSGHASVLNLELETGPWGGDGSSSVDINAITAGAGDDVYPYRIPPDPARLAQSGKPACQFFGTKHGCVLGSFCPNGHDVTSIATHPLGKVSCLNCGMIPTKQTVAHIQKDCWRHGSKAFDENRWTNELQERRQGAVLRKYEMLKEAQTKGNARADAAARKKSEEQDRTKRINDLEVEVQELRGTQPKSGAPPKAPNASAVPEEEKERRRVQSERDKCLALVREQAGVREALKRDMIKKGEISQKDLKGAKEANPLEAVLVWRKKEPEGGELGSNEGGEIVKKQAVSPDVQVSTEIAASVEGVAEITNVAVVPRLALMDSGAEICADAPTHADTLVEHPCVTSTKGVFGEPRDFDTTKEGVALIPNLSRPIISECRTAKETDWRKNWVGDDTCVCVRWPSPAAEQAHYDYIKSHASEIRHFVIENGQTKMPWALYNTIQADLGLSRPRHGNDGHDATRSIAHVKKEDPKSPGGPSFRHRAGGDKFELKPLVGRQARPHILIQTLLISTAGFPIGCDLNPDTRNASEISTIHTASGPVSLCPLRKRDEDDADDGSDDDRDPGKRGRKRPRYGPEEWADTDLSEDIEYVFGFSRALGIGGKGHVATYPKIEYGRVIWFADLTGDGKPGFEGLKNSFVFRQAGVNSIYSIPTHSRKIPDLAHAIRRWCIQDGNMACPKTLIMDREKSIERGYSNSTNATFLQVCSECSLTIQLTIPDRGCRPAEGGVSMSDDHARFIQAKSNLHKRHIHRLQQFAMAKREISQGRIGSMINITISELVPGTLCWCILTRKQRNSIHMPRDCPRCCLFVIVSFDEHSHFGVYGELITPWKREIVLTVVSYGQLRISNVMAYGLQRFGGVFRRVAGYVDGKEVIQLPDQGWQGGDRHHAMDDSEDEAQDVESVDWNDMPEEQRTDQPIAFDEDGDDESDDDLDVDSEMRQVTESIRLIPMKSLHYCYRYHREGLHTIKQERAMYGAELDITVEYIRKRGLNSKRIEAIAVDRPETRTQSINVADATEVISSDNHTGVQGAPDAAPKAASSIPHEAVIPRLKTEFNQDEISADPSRVSQQATASDQDPARITLKELDDPALNRLMRKGRRLAYKINHAIKSRPEPTAVQGADHAMGILTGSRARQLCEVVRAAHARLPQDMPREHKEINITEGISERLAYTQFKAMDWNAAEQDEFQKIIVNLECLEGPFLIDEVRQHCGPEDTIAMIAYVYARKGIEKDEEHGLGKCKVRLVYVGDKIRNMITGESTRVLSESRRPPAAGWEIDLQTATAPLLGLNHNRDVDITAAFPAVSMPYHGQRHYVRARGRLLQCLCAQYHIEYVEGKSERLCWMLKKNLYGFPCAQDNFDSHIAFQLKTDQWSLMCPELSFHMWVKTEAQTVGKFNPDTGEVTTTTHERATGTLVKYVDDCRWSTQTEAQSKKTENYLQLVYGKFRDSSDMIGVMLGKDYTLHQGLDGPDTTRLVMSMQSTEAKYVKEALDYFGDWSGMKPNTPLPTPGTFIGRIGEHEIQGDGGINVVSAAQGQHVGRLGWLAAKCRPELLESYRHHSSALHHWAPDLDTSLHRTFMWLSLNPLDMHQFINSTDVSLYMDSGRPDFPLAVVYLRIILFTDACHEWISVTGYLIVMQGAAGSRVIIRWRSGTTKLRSTSSTYSELEALHLGVVDFLPIWQAVAKLFGAHVEGVIYVDSQSALTIVQNGFSKGLLWLSGVDRCEAADSRNKLSPPGEELHVATSKGRILKIQLLHELIANLLRHVRSSLMMADTLTKQLATNEFQRHLYGSFQLLPRNETSIRPLCACMRCEGPLTFGLSRCTSLANDGSRFCTSCSGGCQLSPPITPRKHDVAEPLDRARAACSCPCRGNNWGPNISNLTTRACAALALMPRADSLPINVPFTMTDSTDHRMLPMQEDLWSQLVLVGFGIAIILTILVATYFWIIGVRGSRHFIRCKITYVDDYLFLGADGNVYAGGDQQEDVSMQQWNKAGGGQDGGGGKRRSGDDGNGGDDDPDGDKLSELLKRLLNQDDRRTPEQKDLDRDRRLNTQCVYIGWFDEDADMRAVTGLKRRYRRCREHMTKDRKPWCHYHYLKQNDDPEKDPESKESKKDKKDKGGHGSGNSTGVPNAPSAVLGGRKTR